MALKLIIGNKNYSSWSFRPWIAMKVAGIAFEETVISLDAADFKAHVGSVSGTGKVPVLIDNDVQVWESLAIMEYLAEKFPNAGLWPADTAARANARVVANEMIAVRVSAKKRTKPGRSCSATLAPPMPCMRRWSRACTPMRSRSAPAHALIW